MKSGQRKVSLVTCGVRGLGLAVARALADRGDIVHITYRGSHDRASALEAEFSGRVHLVDLSDANATSMLIETIAEQSGRLDNIVHAVGDYETGTASSAETLVKMWQSNVQTAMNVADSGLGMLREAQGAFVFFGCAGLAGLGPRRASAAYAASKSALVVLMRSLALEEAAFGVRVNMISPGLIPHDAAHKGTLDPDLIAKIPMGRVGTPEEVASAALWLTSDGSLYTTGADIPVAGGWML